MLTRTYYHQYRLFTIRAIINRWAPPRENLTATYIQNVSRLTGIPPDEPIGIPSDQPARWMAVGIAMAIQENGTESLDYFAMLRGWGLARDPSAGSGTVCLEFRLLRDAEGVGVGKRPFGRLRDRMLGDCPQVEKISYWGLSLVGDLMLLRKY